MAVSNILEKARPFRDVLRHQAYFSSDKAENAAKLLNAEQIFGSARSGATQHLCTVSVPEYTKAPMVLVNAIRRRLALPNVVEQIATEYWGPDEQWQFREFLGRTMTIVEEISWADAMQ